MMATVIGDAIDIRLEFTSFEVELMREIAFNTGKTLEQVAAERLQHGVYCEQPGEQNVDTQDSQPPTDEYGGMTFKEANFRDRLEQVLNELYNIAWSRGHHSDYNVLDEEARRLHIAIRADMIMNEVNSYEP